jgi:hypothetical protein
MSKFVYRQVSILHPDTKALLGRVLVGIPKTTVEALRAKPNHEHADEDALVQELMTDADIATVERLVMSPFGGCLTELTAPPFAESSEDLADPVETSAEGKSFWRLT